MKVATPVIAPRLSESPRPVSVPSSDSPSEIHRHVGAEELLDAVGDQLPNVSLPTVYSALDALEDSGLVRRVSAGQGRALYDARPADHHHLVCRRCGAVEDLDASVSLSGALASAREHGFAPDGAEVVVRGLCASCRAT